MKQKIAVLIMSSGQRALQYLLDLLDDRFFIVVHVDQKSGIDNASWRMPSHAVFCQQRFPVFWGGFNLVLAIRECIRTAFEVNRDFARFAVIAGDSLPVVPLESLEAALLDLDREYMGLFEIANDPSLRNQPLSLSVEKYGNEQPWRFQNYCFYDDELLSPRSRLEAARKFGLDPGTTDYLRGSTERIVNSIVHHLPPRSGLFPKLFFGECWWALSCDSIRLIADDMFSEVYTEYFRFFRNPDEHFFHCLLGNKSVALTTMGKTFAGNMMFVDQDPARAHFGNDALTVEEIKRGGYFGDVIA